MNRRDHVVLGINLMTDPAVAVVRDGRVLAYSEEERHVRIKHAANLYPAQALRYCLDVAGVPMDAVTAVAINWNLEAYTDGRMKAFYESLGTRYPIDENTRSWQTRNLRIRHVDVYRESHVAEWRRLFGAVRFPPIHAVPHHYVHAFHAYMESGFGEAVCLTVDGSGDQHCTVVWRCEGEKITPIREIVMPHSLGWVYAAFTEYLGFQAYDGEYKVMGLAAYGRSDAKLREQIGRIVSPAPDGVEYQVDPRYIHYGAHSYSARYTDRLVELFGRPPRRSDEEITGWHEDVAFAVQENLEETVIRLVRWAVEQTGLRKVCIGGGVGLNVKMNSRIFLLPEVEDVFAHPLCADSGAAAGVAIAACHQLTGARPKRLTTLALGPEESSETIEKTLTLARLVYERPANMCEAVAEELARGRIVGWFQGRMEAGPRALGQRSILADPRRAETRDKVNAIIKFREYWRPFCPSILAEAMPRYFDRYTDAPFMIIAFPANDRLRTDAPAIVHVDGTSRVQTVNRDDNPLYHALLCAFERRTGLPVLLNTSFNVKGEPIVCTVVDALRTFWSTGLEILAIGDFLVRKPGLGTQ
jgi:carbamoyltransferase